MCGRWNAGAVPGARAAWRVCVPRARRTPRSSPTPSSPCSRKSSARARQHTASTTSAGLWPGVQTVIRRRLRVSLSVATVWRLLKRHGWYWQAPARPQSARA
ncbi:winged helix-turn-helix domain-containing protein [Streptomyces sp. SPB4]|uniref:winged helix-turn-helix domain-containing protein n=1 Tax=Streptomyces sp. SPB4 TaxID=2940553 RepID=UPI0032AEDD76